MSNGMVHRVNYDNRKNIFDPKYPKFFENTAITQESYFQTIASCNSIMKTDSQRLIVIRNVIAILTLLQTVLTFSLSVLVIILCVIEEVGPWILLSLLVIIPMFLLGTALCIGGYIFAIVRTHTKVVSLLEQYIQDQNRNVYEPVGFQLILFPAHPIKESSKTTCIEICNSNAAQQYHNDADNQFTESESNRLI